MRTCPDIGGVDHQSWSRRLLVVVTTRGEQLTTPGARCGPADCTSTMLQFTLLTGAAALSTSHDRPPATLARRAFLGTTTCVPFAAYAACLPSDAAVECIGVYKERSTDVTKEDAKAAGIRWVDQPSFTSCTNAANYLRDVRPQIAKWRSSADFTSVGQDLLRVRPRVQAATQLLAANVDLGSATLLNRAAESALYSMDAADVALGFAIRETNTRYVITRAAAAADALDAADADYCELVRFVDALYPPAEKSNKAKRKRQ